MENLAMEIEKTKHQHHHQHKQHKHYIKHGFHFYVPFNICREKKERECLVKIAHCLLWYLITYSSKHNNCLKLS